MELGTSFFKSKILFGILFCQITFAQSVEQLQKFEIASDLRLSKHRYGGISGLAVHGDSLWAVSDDRGQFGPPRIIKQIIKQDLSRKSGLRWEVKPEEEIVLGNLKDFPVFDLESLVSFNDGTFLLSSEGDFNKKPRVFPFVKIWSKTSGWGESLNIPDDFFPEPTGLQTKGLYNNSGFEAMTVSPDEQNLYLMSEVPLFQSKKPEIEFLHYKKMIQADSSEKAQESKMKWFLQERKTYKRNSAPEGANEVLRGVTEILYWKTDHILLLERWVRIGTLKPLGTGAELFSVRLSDFQKKKLFTLEGDLAGNWEGMAFGPDLSDGRKLLVLVTDNNFEKGEPTRYLFLALKDL